AAGAARREVAAFDPDVVHLHEPFAPVLSYRVLRVHAVPTVATFHRAGGGPAVSLFAPWLKRAARRLDAAAAVSHAAADTARAYGVSATVLFNGFETERFLEFPRERHEGVTVLFVGRLEPRKGAGVALDAMLGHGRPDWRLVVAGDGPERAALERRAAGDARVTFLGAVSDADKRRWLRRADVAVAPSVGGESFGLVVLEAMASGTPVVASDIDGYREAAGDAGVLVAPGDASALAHGVAEALLHREPLAAAGLDHAATWSMRSLVDRYESLYASAGDAFARRR
ncbi:MAG TPA: glycosyltransferase family 4 protein, partial [Acidimicrobiales bacterium]|nr:glycosyltransferase family 4 protein [Acidimicrobiales bacterium]